MKKLTLASAAALAIAISASLFWPRSPEAQLEELARAYVRLALSLEALNPEEVDVYYGPDSLADAGNVPLPELEEQAAALADRVDQIAGLEDSSRQQQLHARLTQLQTIAAFLQAPQNWSFAEETQELYQLPLEELPEDTRLDDRGRLVIETLPPTPVEIERDAVLERLSELLPGTGSLPFRVASFQSEYVVPVNKREEVFAAALQACRDATLEHWTFQGKDQLTIEWTRDVSAPWHEYLGAGMSRLRINPLTIGYIGSMVDVACHEGYPGHHAQFLLRDNRVGADWVENQLVLLRSPEAALLEGAADYAVALALPPERRLNFERETLFPLAELDSDQIETYAEIHRLISGLDLATVATIQEFSDGELPETAAVVRLERDALVPSPRALLEFVNSFSAYAVGYTIAERQLDSYIDNRRRQTGESPWGILSRILTDPALIEPVFSAPN